MKLTKKLEAEVMQIHNAYWDNYLKGDVEAMKPLLDKDYTQVGSAEGEVFSNKKDAVQFLYNTIDQVAGKLDMRNRITKLELQGDTIVVHERCDLYALADDKWVFYSKFRATTLMQEKKHGWKITHQHSSFPDAKTEDGQNIAIDKIAAENLQLREAVRRRTIELEHKNRELEVESSLERVRTVAMAMKEPNDMLDVCRMISEQLALLNVKEIRNVQTAIIYENKGTYLNYEYYAKHDKLLITEVDYKFHEIQKKFASQMLKGAEELFVMVLKGKELSDWYAYQKTTNQFVDVYLEKAKSLSYHWYSLGPVALGISTYHPLKKEEIDLFKRFRNVFELAYKRFIDIEKAAAQAKEARIETSLERVRAQAMSMRKPDDLHGICEILYAELHSLGFVELRNTMVNIFDDDKGSFLSYDYSAHAGKTIANLFYNTHPVIEKQVQQARSSDDAFSEAIFSGKDLADWKEFRKKAGEADDPNVDGIDSVFYYFYSIETGVIGISTYSSISPEKRNVIKRFRNVFDFAYRRYIDVVQAEAQAKEAQIELALERVRARTMAMQKSAELSDASLVLFQQLRELGEPAEQLSIGIINEEENLVEVSVTLHGNSLQHAFRHSIDEPILMNKIYNSWKQGKKSLIVEMKGEELQTYNKYRDELVGTNVFTQTQYPGDRRIVHSAFFSRGMLALATNEHRPVESLQLLERFARVFDGTYVRFLDLQKAEAQARESQIELALERVRARAMSMQKSGELRELIGTVFTELTKLDVVLTRCLIMIYDPTNDSSVWWMANSEAPSHPIGLYIQYHQHKPYAAYIKAWKEKQVKWSYILEGQDKTDWDNFLFVETELSKLPAPVIAGMKAPAKVYLQSSFNNFGNLTLATLEALSEEHFDILLRFAKVFDLTYTRFNDLQKAEAQAKEAKIEASLERVRAKAMSMHESSELDEVLAVLFDQFDILGIESVSAHMTLVDIENNRFTFRETGKAGHRSYGEQTVAIDSMDIWKDAAEKWRTSEPLTINSLHFPKESLPMVWQVFHESFASMPDNAKIYPEDYPDGIYHTAGNCKFGYIGMNQVRKATEEEEQIVLKFATEFGRLYQRFLDLKKAEAQAKEAKLEASLERVRAKAMAMHNSQDLADTIVTFYHEIQSFSIIPRRCGVGLLNKSSRIAEISTMNTTEQGTTVEVIGKLKMQDHPVLDGVFDNWLLQKEYHPVLRGKEIKEYYQLLRPQIPFPDYPNDSVQYGYFFFFPEGGVYAWTDKEMPEDELKLYRRFTSVLSLAYKRYIDLKEAEAQARESRIEAALERVRSRTLAMQRSDELAETAVVLFRQLIELGIEPNRLYIGVVKDESGDMEMWATDEDGTEVGTKFMVNRNESSFFNKLYDGWAARKKSLVVDMQGKELEDYFHYLKNVMQVPFKGGLSQKRRVQHVAYFSKGLIGMASPDEQSEGAVQLLERFAAVFNLTFTRFNDLKIAEAHAEQAQLDLIKLQTEKKRAEDALTELRATQTQLIHAEKMASLGELTAGIAHEIQNPLNFVNNFSEVSNELIDEMNAEIEKGDMAEARAIASDIKQNLEKINHHGKRADTIVKGMLQHSRASTATREPTDINKLADEYLRLAYHGLRAKDKTFNASMKTSYDDSIGNISVIPQDIGRVILNLITNAFYAVAEKKKQAAAGYEPTVTVITKKINDKVQVRVKDNGNGVPQKVLDKIFQPFFTTKPTGQGTGLGLSLSYDIVKAHGGILNVDTLEGQGAEFFIQIPIA